MIFSRRLLLGLTLLCLLAGRSLVRADDSPEATIAVLDDGLMSVMKAGETTPFPKRFEMLVPAVERVFDLPLVLKACVGPRWSNLARSEQQRLLDEFTRFTIASYVANFDNYNGERFEILPERRQVGEDVVIATRIVRSDQTSSRIDYVMRRVDGTWKAVDILLDGTISRVAVQRSDFRGLLAHGDAAALIASLQRKVADLSGGTMNSG
jgi:phospholipid transport system substrate-binding protein